jgi:hypothetical protein
MWENKEGDAVKILIYAITAMALHMACFAFLVLRDRNAYRAGITPPDNAAWYLVATCFLSLVCAYFIRSIAYL